MKEFTTEMYEKLAKANEEVKGTIYSNRYRMQTETKTKGWHYIGWGFPTINHGEIKTVKLTTYIMVKDGYGCLYRYIVNENVKQLLGI